MKKITTFLFSLFAVAALAQHNFSTGDSDQVFSVAERGGASVVLSHSTDNVNFGNGVACGGGGTSADNVFYRTYTPSDFGIVENFNVEAVRFAFVFTDVSGGATIDVTATLWTSDDVFPNGTYTMLTSETVTLGTGEAGTVVEVPMTSPPNVAAGTEVIVSISMPDNVDPVMFDARSGANAAGQSAPNWLTSEACGITFPTTSTDIGFPDNHIILDLVGTEDVLSVDDNALSQISVFPNPVDDVVNVRTPGGVEINDAVIYDVLGKASPVQVINGQINVQNLSRGVYILNLNTSAGTLTKKIVKQ